MKILIVDDDELIANLLDENLRLEGYETFVCGDGISALEAVDTFKPDLIVLDIMLPKLDGFHVCRKLQGRNIPVIMLTAKGDITDKLIGLESGADDYMVKPFDSRELLARINSIFRRLNSLGAMAATSGQPEEVPGLKICEETRLASVNGLQLDLTPTEFKLLLLFSRNPGIVYTRNQLLDEVWGYDFLGDSRTVDIHIQRLRKKLGTHDRLIETVFGTGYRFRG